MPFLKGFPVVVHKTSNNAVGRGTGLRSWSGSMLLHVLRCVTLRGLSHITFQADTQC